MDKIVLICLISLLFGQTPTVANDLPPYDTKLERLAEMLGAIHFLRVLCDGQDDELWRKQMSALLKADAATEERKQRYISAFNDGVLTNQRSYNQCTSSAQMLFRRYLEESATLIDELIKFYGR